uniref:ATP synthase F0 subunit 8 n=1 Tax=Platerodrilus sp. MNCN/DNA:86739 TaxID=1905348 RepID=A0A342Z5E1_9COLE|nr:ATP synthase F0 subunit 8 [Platerodrilus sp. MNCN/DNA:86739]
MPQMAPTMWLNMLILTSTIIITLNPMIFFQMKKLNLNKKIYKNYFNNWKW